MKLNIAICSLLLHVCTYSPASEIDPSAQINQNIKDLTKAANFLENYNPQDLVKSLEGRQFDAELELESIQKQLEESERRLLFRQKELADERKTLAQFKGHTKASLLNAITTLDNAVIAPTAKGLQ
jgi:hypothetical protein